MRTISLNRWEELVRAGHTVSSSRQEGSERVVVIVGPEGADIEVSASQAGLNSLGPSSSSLEFDLQSRLAGALLLDGDSASLRLGEIEGRMGYYDAAHSYVTFDSVENHGGSVGSFGWTANSPGQTARSEEAIHTVDETD